MTNNNLKIGILETGRLPDDLVRVHGDYPEMVANWLSPFDASFAVYPVLDDVFPADPADCDLWAITGSRTGVYDDHSWIGKLEDFIRACRISGRKMIGTCFGHQIIAQALGGISAKSDKGWGLGVHEYSTSHWPDALGPAPENLRFLAVHQDQVTSAPPDAVRVATSDFCENAALWYPGFALTVQGHPEFSESFARALLESRRGMAFPETDVANALLTVHKDTNHESFARYIRDHLALI